VTENRILRNQIIRNQIKGRVRLRNGECKTLAEIGQKLDKQAPVELAKIVKPDTILAWHRMLIAQTFDGSKQRKTLGRSKIGQKLEALVVRMAQENRSWGYERIAGALTNLGHTVSNQTVRNILKWHGLPQECGNSSPAAMSGRRVGCSALDKAIRTDPYCAAEDVTRDVMISTTGSMPAL
jgi:putative transposase